MALLSNYSNLLKVTERLDTFLCREHPDFFGDRSIHPVLPLKRSKVIHDNLWGTFDCSWAEMAVLDTPLLQKLRDIHQVGLAYQIYPSARHSRLEHSLGVLVVASRIFDALAVKHRGKLRDTVKVVFGEAGEDSVSTRIAQLKDELRLAALLHDVGHSLHSHASERVYSKLTVLKDAAEELSDFAGKRKGAGEVISFCFALTPCLQNLLNRARKKVLPSGQTNALSAEIDLENVALIIIGRSKHPLLQFLGDIISSDIDADKLDYLLRDSNAAGLPLRYDIDMYLYSAQFEGDVMVDGEGALKKLYASAGAKNVERLPARENIQHEYYEGQRLCLPKRAMHVLEQIVICKMMLFSYVYHHPKVRAAEGLLERMLDSMVEGLKKKGKTEWQILEWFLDATDADLMSMSSTVKTSTLKQRAYRLVNRILPREVLRLSASDATGPQKTLLANFLTVVRDKEKGAELVQNFEAALGDHLKKKKGFRRLASKEALVKAGAWLDVSKAPSFEETQKVVSKGGGGRDQASGMFPVHAWQHAYASYRCYVRVFAYSEHIDAVRDSAIAAMKQIIGIEDEAFYKAVERSRV
jgi:HD superfamily phosphohydrolase